MESIYTILICKRCNKSTIVLTEEVEDTKNKNKYLACAYCGSKRLMKVGETSEFKELFKNDEKRR